jgi:hypothetical protein
VIRIDVSSNIAEIRRAFPRIAEELQDKALVRALNRTGSTVRTAAVREIRAEYPGFKAAATRDAMRMRQATREDPAFTLEVRGRRLPLIDFSARQTRRGVSVNIKGRKVIGRAFIARMKSGHVGVFARVQPDSPKGSPVFRYGPGSRIHRRGSDIPITELDTMSVPRAFMQKKIQQSMRRVAVDALVKNYRAELNYQSIRARA